MIRDDDTTRVSVCVLLGLDTTLAGTISLVMQQQQLDMTMTGSSSYGIDSVLQTQDAHTALALGADGVATTTTSPPVTPLQNCLQIAGSSLTLDRSRGVPGQLVRFCISVTVFLYQEV